MGPPSVNEDTLYQLLGQEQCGADFSSEQDESTQYLVLFLPWSLAQLFTLVKKYINGLHRFPERITLGS